MTDAVSSVECRVLDGPNLYFPRPAIKLTIAIPGWLRASDATVAHAASRLGMSGSTPGPPASHHRSRFVAKVAREITRRVAAEAGVRRLAVRARTGPDPGQIVVAFPWRRRGAAEALARAVTKAMNDVLRRSPDRVIAELARTVSESDPGPEPHVPDPSVPVVQITGTNGKTTTVRLLAHLVREAGQRVAYSSTDGVYRDGRRVKRGDYSGFGGAATALAHDPEVAVLETARGGILLRGVGVLHNDVAVVTNVSADHLDLHGIHTVDQLAEVKGTIVRITRPDGWDVLNADDPRVLAMRRTATGRIWVYALDHAHPAIRDTLDEGGRATTVIDGRIAWLERHRVRPLVDLMEVPLTLSGISGMFTSNALAATSAAVAIGLPERAIVRGLRSFVLTPEANPGRANLFSLDRRIVVVDYAHNEAGVLGLTQILRGLARPGADVWLAICTAGDRTPALLHGFAFRAAVGSDHLGIADLRHYLRGKSADEVYAELAAAAADAGVTDPPRYRGELHALRVMLGASKPGDVIGVTALGMRSQIFRWLRSAGARRLGPGDVKRCVRAAARGSA